MHWMERVGCKVGILALTRPGSPEQSQLGSLSKPKDIRTWGHREPGCHQECGEGRQSGGARGTTGAHAASSSRSVHRRRDERREQAVPGQPGLTLALFTPRGSRTPGVWQAGTQVCTHQRGWDSILGKKPPCQAVTPARVRKEWGTAWRGGRDDGPLPKATRSRVLDQGVPYGSGRAEERDPPGPSTVTSTK